MKGIAFTDLGRQNGKETLAVVQELVKSMLRRVIAVIASPGGYTNYLIWKIDHKCPNTYT